MRSAVVLVVALCAAPVWAEMIKPAELPPAGYAGQQYVDSKGCLFVRAGQQPDRELWVPRVTRDGKPLCDNPPSGRQVPVVGDGSAALAAPEAEAASVDAAQPEPEPAVTRAGYFVAVGSFAVVANADAAVAQLKALNYPAARGRVAGGSEALVTVFAGPFADAGSAARAETELKGAGFPEAVRIDP